MEKGIIYVMTTVVPGLVKIGKTRTDQFENRMNTLEKNGYRNITGLKREFAIEVKNYDEKETLLHTIFEKSQVSDTELFAVDINLVKQLLSSFEGTQVYPKDETKKEVFEEATEQLVSKNSVPNGKYILTRVKTSDGNRIVRAIAVVTNGSWTLLKGSDIGVHEDKGVSKRAKQIRAELSISEDNKLLEDYEFGVCSPSLIGSVVINQSCDGWTNWITSDGRQIGVFKKQPSIDE